MKGLGFRLRVGSDFAVWVLGVTATQALFDSLKPMSFKSKTTHIKRESDTLHGRSEDLLVSR